MKSVRIIPRLDIKGPNLVKGIHLEGLRVLGRPEEFARRYYEDGADELLYADVVASLYQRNSLHDIIARTARETFIPLTVSGGLRTLEDIRAVLRAGADKVAINTAAIRRPEFIREAARTFGSSTILVAIEASRQDGRWLAFTDNGREHTGVEVLGWARRAEELGAGELLLTSIDREGTGEGFDLELTRLVSESVSIPVIACGGCGGLEHLRQVLTEGRADACALASVLHYGLLGRMDAAPAAGAGAEGNTEYLRNRSRLSRIQETSLPEIKRHLAAAGIDCRPAAELHA